MKKILIVEDDVDTIDMVETILTMTGFAVIKINREITIEEIAGIRPDLVILDYLLPYALGNKLCLLIKTHPGTYHIPVILYSASNVGKQIASDYKADAYLSKPFDVDDLLKLVNQLIG